MDNETWSALLIETLLAQGIDYFCCAPGSRSIPLLTAIAENPLAKHSVHFDERGVCFHAVGYAKASGKAAVVVATSGTAVGNLLPGMMEAYNERVPLILLTADRPPELRDCGANQTCNQVQLFANHVRWQVDLPCPEAQLGASYLVSAVSHAVAMTRTCPRGPVHVNCMFREPLLTNQKQEMKKVQVHFETPQLFPSKESVEHWTREFARPRRGVILAGSHYSDQSEEIFALAQALNWPVFADILSGPRRYEDHPHLITHFDPILKCKGGYSAEAVIQFGDRYVSKTLGQWLEKQTPAYYLHLSEHPMRQDPFHLVTHRLQTCPKRFVQEVLHGLEDVGNEAWLEQWKQWDRKARCFLDTFFSEETELTEPGVVREIASLVSEDWALFLSNSMPIRDATQFFSPLKRCGPIFGNRGVSGIDGNIATAAGIAHALSKPTLAVLGDLSFLHDLNSLAYLHKTNAPVVLCVINNAGGGIFSFLPIAQRKECFEEFIAASHEMTLAAAATLFQIPYFHPQTREELQEIVRCPQSCIVEITTDRVHNVQLHQQLLTQLAQCLHSADSPTEIPATLH